MRIVLLVPNSIVIVIFLVLLLISESNTVSSPACLDFNGNPVEWYIAYVVPKTSSNTDEQGTYFYFDNKIPSGIYHANVLVTSSMSAPARTIQQVYDSKATDSGWAMYNDELPLSVLKSRHITDTLFKPKDTKHFYNQFAQKTAHAKGVLHFNSIGGFWLIHSVPKYPPPYPGPYSYTSTPYGQTYICISVPLSYIDYIGKLFQVNYPEFYNHKIPNSLVKSVPNLVTALNAQSSNNITWLNYTFYTYPSKLSWFVVFAKSPALNGDLYSKVVAPQLKTTLLVETWKRTSPLPSCCPNSTPPNNCTSALQVENVLYVNLGSGTSEFRYTKDHSKWAITSIANNLICIGDINREASQAERGGGTLCLYQPSVRSWIYNAITQKENC